MKIIESWRERLRPWYLRNIYFTLHPQRRPPYFGSCWNFPDYRDAGTPAEDNPIILVLPMNDWHTRMQRTQHLARYLSRHGYRCVYLNPHLGREFPGARSAGEAERLTVLEPNVYELHVHLPREPVFHHRALRGDEVGLIAEALERVLRRLNASRVMQLVAFPVWLDVARIIRRSFGAPLIYDCHDYLPGFAGVADAVAAIEPELFRESDGVLCSSAHLLKRARLFSRAETPCVLLRNGADSTFFEIPCRSPGASASPTIGYVGALDSWFDVQSVEFAARSRPHWRFELIGRVEDKRIRVLEKLPNVKLAGEVPFDTLPGRLSHFSVGIIPFLLNPLIEATDPIKAYEYFGAGLPVVSSQLPELERFGALIATYVDSADFVAKLDTAISSDNAESVARRREAAREETWERRGDELIRAIQSLV